jgi:hypothetical protein
LALSACGPGGGGAPNPVPVAAQSLAGDDGDKRAEEFKLYTTPHPDIDPACDVYTHMALAYTATGLQVTLQDRVAGACATDHERKARHFELTQISEGCGSRGYQGTGISLVDNRYRTCKDRVLTRIIVRESPNGDFAGRTLYSL